MFAIACTQTHLFVGSLLLVMHLVLFGELELLLLNFCELAVVQGVLLDVFLLVFLVLFGEFLLLTVVDGFPLLGDQLNELGRGLRWILSNHLRSDALEEAEVRSQWALRSWGKSQLFLDCWSRSSRSRRSVRAQRSRESKIELQKSHLKRMIIERILQLPRMKKHLRRLH